MNEELERKLARREHVTQSLLLVHKTCASLSLTDRSATCDTLVNLASSLLEVRRGSILLLPREDAEQYVYCTYDTPREGLKEAHTSRLFAALLAERAGRVVSADEVARDWPDAPTWCSAGFASATIDIADRAIGVLLVADRISSELFDEELDLLTGCAAIAAMALANVELHEARERSLEEARQQTEAARRIAAEQEHTLAVIGAQRAEIRVLSTPILQVRDDTVALPIVGTLDAERSAAMTERLLQVIATQNACNVIVDLTGLERMDEETAGLLLTMVKAAELLGARCFMSGARPRVAMTIADLDVDLSKVVLRRTLRDALESIER